ncbi:dihydropteroate synthase [Sulfuriferula sp. AH1]|uniref:dihydropteroate synthase n=1 Tax=Sulfuriferula sp. AH1 TaxID=1985873 RepID=UPI000B582921|nr:dihydropteroate synthase [Sulfuriferula sp. AH1]ARU30704.1 dihydropteroate synthase [Sulfuriferula sp. AH1]
MQVTCGDMRLDLSRPRIMGIVNVTPDSFSDGGEHDTLAAAADHARKLIAEGADIIDIGGESTRPMAETVSVAEELERVIPLVEILRGCGAIISVDTRKPEVMHAAIQAGAHMINDVQALQAEGALSIVAPAGVAVCVLHMQGEPQNMQRQANYNDVTETVYEFLQQRIDALLAAGVARERIIIDPGFGFGKQLQHNLQLLKHLAVFTGLNYPILVGMSRKSMLGALTGRAVGEREAAGLAAHLYAVNQGANIIRVHDVAACRDALTVWQAIKGTQ